MNIPYQPSTSLSAKISRKMLPLLARRNIHFTLDKPIVSFTFDDFPRSAITNGSDILEREGWRATFYVAAGLTGENNHHGKHFVSEDIPGLANRGHEIAGHTYTHVDCDRLGYAETLAEIKRNKEALAQMGYKGKIEHFAYPFGAANAKLKNGLQNKFRTLRGVTPGVHIGKADLNALKSTPLYSGSMVDNAMQTIKGLSNRPGWLILFAHDIRQTPSQWGCTPEEFSSAIKAVKQSGAQVLTVGAALDQLEAQHG